MLEAKAKDLALLRLRHQLTSRGLSTDDGAIRLDSGGAYVGDRSCGVSARGPSWPSLLTAVARTGP